jgi:hypothetical protein
MIIHIIKILCHLIPVYPNTSLPYAVDLITQEFAKVISNNDAVNEKAHFSNQFGFSLFLKVKDQKMSYGLASKIYDSHLVSTGGLKYYGYSILDNNNQHHYYYQILPINVLAETLFLYSFVQFPKIKDDEWWIACPYFEMASLANEYKNYPAIFKLTHEILELHEQGHGLCVNGDKTLYQFFSANGVKDEEFFQPGFATSNDLKAWERMKNNCATSRDVLFLLGDFLADFAALLTNPSLATTTVIRAFNWNLSALPWELNKRPRGRVSLLRYALDKDFDHCFDHLKKIIKSTRQSPDKTLSLIREMELANWQILEKHYKLKHYR